MATTRKKLDNRIKTLIENGIASNHRSIFAVVGDKGRDQIPILYHIMAKCCVKPNPNVLWAYKKELGFSSNRKKRLRRATKMFKSRVKDVNESNPFEVFTVSTKIRYCYYKEVQNIMGQTYGMCILQDFEALTPNILAQTIETVEGGGMVVFLLSSIKSLKQLCVMKMDVHARYREGSTSDDVVGRFNERFILALSDCNNYLVLNDSLEVMPISKTPPTIEPLPPKAKGLKNSEEDIALKELTSALMDSTETTLAGTLVSCCATLDQGRAVLKMIDALADLTINSTVVMTAGRGRGKSAALGLVMAAAIAYGYRNIYVTSPSPENLKTLFEYIKIGLIALKYEKNREYKVILSSEKELRNVVVKIEISRDGYHQTIEYVNPKDHQMVARADLVCIDEAAAIPTTHVKKLFGSHHVFMSSTIDGYEGTGSTLSTRFIDVLKQRCTKTEKGIDLEKLLQRLRNKVERISCKQRVETLYEIELQCPIRYSDKDPVEQWLKTLLCLNVREPLATTEIHPPEHCKLYYVNRDTLFSFQKETEKFLQNLVSMFVASHYKYSPNDIQMLSDAPNHHVFCLLGPNAKTSNNPTILCALQIALEGEISREAVNNALKRGLRENIDAISWTVDSQFPHLGFNNRSGARVVTVATHPKLQGKGYGSKTLELLIEHLEGQRNLGEEQEDEDDANAVVNVDPSQIIDSKMKVNAKLPPLLMNANKAKIGKLDYVGVSFDASYPLVRFFKSKGMVPVYVDIDRNLLTEEHNCIMLRMLKHKSVNADLGGDDEENDDEDKWLQRMFEVFRRSFVLSLNMDCRSMHSPTSLALLRNKDMTHTINSDEMKEAISLHMTEYNLKLLDEFMANRLDYTQIPDVVTKLTKLVFDRKLEVALDSFQSTILLAKGLQKKSQVDLISELQAIGVSVGHPKMYDDALDLAIRAVIKSLKKCEPVKPNQIDEVQGKTSLKRKADEETADDKKTKKKRTASQK